MKKKEQPTAAGPSEGSRGTPAGGVPGGTRFTPGPWRACHNGECSCRQVWSMPGDCPVFTAAPDAHVQIGMAHHDWGDSPDLVYGQIPLEQMQANAKLIAAAPDLYEALLEVRPAYRRLVSGDECWCEEEWDAAASHSRACEQARAALAKARGEV